jgi:hypothetical protein
VSHIYAFWLANALGTVLVVVAVVLAWVRSGS